MPDTPLVVELFVADTEPVRSFIAGVTDAWEHLAALPPDEAEALPGPVRDGILVLGEAVRVLAGELPPGALPEAEPPRGAVILEWPAPPEHGAGGIRGPHVAVYDALTGDRAQPRAITTVTGISVRVNMTSVVTADLTMFTDEAGEPILDGPPVLKDMAILTGTFRYHVAGMRIRQAEPA